MDRDLARDLHQKAGLPFLEVFIDAPLSVLEERDPKGLYKKARAGEIKGNLGTSSDLLTDYPTDFTGISAPYEAPESPEIHIKTDETDVARSVSIITEYLVSRGFISS